MNKADLVGGVGLTIAGLLFIFIVIPLGTEEGAYFGLSPTFFPTLLTSLITLCALGLVVQSLVRLRRVAHDRPAPISGWNLLMFMVSAGLALGGVVLIDTFGMLWGGPALIAAFMLFLGERNLVRLTLTATLPVVLVYFLALHVLGTPVP